MSTKAEVSSSYLEATKAKYAGACLYPVVANVLLTGAKNEDSIGEAISTSLINRDHRVTIFPDDVRGDPFGHPSDYNFKGYSALVMCHGVMHLDWFEDMPLDRAYEIVSVNLLGTIHMVQHFVHETLDTLKRKTIISIGSMAYTKVLNGSAVYCASKAGAAHLMKCLAWELAPKGYDVYSIHPSNVADTPMETETITRLSRYRNLSIPEATAYWKDGMLRPMLLQKSEITGLVIDLIEGKYPYMSGSNIELAGGAR